MSDDRTDDKTDQTSVRASAIQISTEVEELVQLLKANPAERDREELSLGEKALSVFTDTKYARALLDTGPFVSAKRKLIYSVIDDLAGGAPLLMRSRVGLVLANGELVDFSQPHTEAPPAGRVVFSVELKDAAAFKDYSGMPNIDFHEHTANAAIYYLIDLLANEASAN